MVLTGWYILLHIVILIIQILSKLGTHLSNLIYLYTKTIVD